MNDDSDPDPPSDPSVVNLPPISILREILKLYFLYVHPNVPMLDESEIWKLVEDDVFNLGDFSYLVFRAIVFSVAHVCV